MSSDNPYDYRAERHNEQRPGAAQRQWGKVSAIDVCVAVCVHGVGVATSQMDLGSGFVDSHLVAGVAEDTHF